MGRYTGPVCRLCRREGVKLSLKGDRCKSGKCSIERRDRPPGMHNWRRGKLSEYGLRLREKQKVKRHYGVYEKQFKKYYQMALEQPGNTGENLIVLLERRLDNVLCRGGLAYSRRQARQFIGHGHVLVNGQKVDIPSYLIKEGDVVAPANKESAQKIMKSVYDNFSGETPTWLERIPDKPEIKIIRMPVRSEVILQIQDQLIVEFCSR